MKKVMVALCGICSLVVIGTYGYYRINNTVKSLVKTELNAKVVDMYNDNVVIKTSSDEIKIRNSELFDIAYDEQVIDSVNVFNYKTDFSSCISHQLKEEGLKKLKTSLYSSADMYYYVESINSDFELISTAVSKEIDEDKLKADLDISAQMNLSEYLKWEEPDNTVVEEEYMDICNLQDWKLEYDDGLTFTWNDIKHAVSYDTELHIESDVYQELVDKVKAHYNTVGNTRAVNTPKRKGWVEGGTYGWKVDEQAEKKFIKRSIAKRSQIKKHKPKFEQEAYSNMYGKKDLGIQYVVVSISEQHVWYYKNGKVVKESDCVTGTRGRHDTPLGTYAVIEVMPQGKVLRGDDYATPVKKWIRLTNTGIGLHDASWRGNFGGGIYKDNGSHGCINLSYEFANYLCKHVKKGMPVVVMA